MVGKAGAINARAAAFKQKPVIGGSPAMFKNRVTDIKSWEGLILLSVATVFGDEVRLCVSRRSRGVIIKI